MKEQEVMKHMNDQEGKKRKAERKELWTVYQAPLNTAVLICRAVLCFSQNCQFEVCSLLRKACFSEVTQKPNKYLVNY